MNPCCVERTQATSLGEVRMRDMHMDLEAAEAEQGERVSKKMKSLVGVATGEITIVHASDSEW